MLMQQFKQSESGNAVQHFTDADRLFVEVEFAHSPTNMGIKLAERTEATTADITTAVGRLYILSCFEQDQTIAQNYLAQAKELVAYI